MATRVFDFEDSKPVQRAMATYPKAMAANAKVALKRSMGRGRAEFLKTIRHRKRPGRFNLARLWFWDVTGSTLETLKSRFFTRSKAAEGLENEVTIRPKRGRMLALPIGAALTPSGKAKKGFRSPREATQKLGADKVRVIQFPGQLPKVFVVRRQGKTRFAGEQSDIRNRTRLVPIFQLVRSVKSGPTLGFFRFWRGPGLEITAKRMAEAARATLQGRRLA